MDTSNHFNYRDPTISHNKNEGFVVIGGAPLLIAFLAGIGVIAATETPPSSQDVNAMEKSVHQASVSAQSSQGPSGAHDATVVLETGTRQP